MPKRTLTDREGAGIEALLLEPLKNLKLKNTQTHKPASLLGLPAELRNTIYRLTLVEEDPIDLTNATHTTPALTRTSRQLRAETHKIFIEENTFVIYIVDFKPEIPWYFHSRWIQQLRMSQLRLRYSGTRADWKNFKNWMRWFHTPGPLRFGAAMTGPQTLATELALKGSRIVGAMTDRPWEQVAFVLEEWKETTELCGFVWA